MSKPLILIPTPVQDEKRRSFSMGRNYIASVIAAGGVPLMVPVSLDERELRGLYESCAAVMLAGGGDVDPSAYGEAAHEKTGHIDLARDQAEFALSRWAVADDKPLLGICRGIQSLNVALGGSLLQDIPSQWHSTLQHYGNYDTARDQVLHTVRVESGSQAETILKQDEVGVNSFHHQAVKRLAGGFVVTSRATDGIIEAIEMPGKRFMVAVQWHPEEMSAGRADMLELFAALVRAAG
jgi:putative glutamine amidotransferase